MSPPPLALYIHLPWCVRKCPYCDFNSHERRGPLPEKAYIDALLMDLEYDLQIADAGRPGELTSIFIGGGTPSLFSATAVARLLEGISKYFPLPGEITLEANPGSLEATRFRDLREAGITRLSLGVQSFNDTRLRQLGRIHDGNTALRAAETALDAGFEHLNLDLMFGLPDQQEHEALHDIDTALALGASHISHYQLTLEPNTVFYRRPPKLPDADSIARMQARCGDKLRQAGLVQYEVSAWSRPDQHCRHNLNYWQYGDYLGLGAGAHGKLSFAGEDRILRYQRHRVPDTYLQLDPDRRVTRTQVVARHERPLEFAMNGLRLTTGVELDMYKNRTGLPVETLLDPLQSALAQGLARLERNRLRLTTAGLLHLDALLLPLVPEPTPAQARP